MINISLKSSDERVRAALESRRVRIREAVTAELDRLMLDLTRRIQAKLSGEVLQPRKGGSGLLGSVHQEKTVLAGGKLVGRVTAGAGLASVYPAVQEYGGVKDPYDIYPVVKKALAFFPSTSLGATTLRIQGRSMRFQLGKRRGSLKPAKYGEFHELGGIVVKHVVHPALPERSYMRSSMREMQETILERLRVTIRRELA